MKDYEAIRIEMERRDASLRKYQTKPDFAQKVDAVTSKGVGGRWTEWSDKMQNDFMAVALAVIPEGFIVDMENDYGDGIGGALIQILNQGDGHNIKLSEDDNGIEIAEFLDNGDIITHGYRKSFINAAKYTITLYKAGKFIKNYGITNQD